MFLFPRLLSLCRVSSGSSARLPALATLWWPSRWPLGGTAPSLPVLVVAGRTQCDTFTCELQSLLSPSGASPCSPGPVQRRGQYGHPKEQWEGGGWIECRQGAERTSQWERHRAGSSGRCSGHPSLPHLSAELLTHSCHKHPLNIH